MGVVGAALIGVVKFDEPLNFARIACIGLIAAGGIGLRLLGVQK